MDEATPEALPLASAAAWSPTAAPTPRGESKVLTLDEAFGRATAARDYQSAQPALAAAADRMAALRDIARKLRTAPDTDETLQFVIDTACRCTRADAGMLTLQAPMARQFVCGTALGAGPYISVPLRAGGPSFGELVLTRMAEREEYETEDEIFGELVAEYVAKAVATLRSGTVLSQHEQDFIDRVTEELRAPLAGSAGLLRAALGGEHGELSAEGRRYLTATAADVERLLCTVEDLLVLAHLRPPELRHMEAIPVGPLLERNVERLMVAADSRGIGLTYRPAPEPYVIQGVSAQMDLVVGQLIGNAVKFTEAGGRVDVTAGVTEGLVRISVRDTGIGFDPSDAARMTDCFARASTAEAARIPGLGIGLYLANQIVANHGGRLWLESRRDEGTKAHVTLPPRSDSGA